MTLRRGAFILVTAGVFGAIVGIAFSGSDLISARVWLGGAAVIVVAILLRDFLAISSVERATFVAAWSLSRPHRTVSDGPPGLLNIHALLVNAIATPRSFTIHLRPRLVKVARHFLPLRNGIDFEHDPDQVAQLLGEVAWIIDPAVLDRSPTLAEVERFLDLTLVDCEVSPR